jgi:hypothetical protein
LRIDAEIATHSQGNFFSAENFAEKKESLENDQRSAEKTEYLINDHFQGILFSDHSHNCKIDSTTITNTEMKKDSNTGILLIDSNTYLFFKLSLIDDNRLSIIPGTRSTILGKHSIASLFY